MPLLDLVISGGTVVSSDGHYAVNIGIKAGRVALWADPALPLDAADRIDATGMMVLPGVIDAHVHMREPGLVYKEGFSTGSMAAAIGGVTTIMVMPTDDPWTHNPEHFENKLRMAEDASHVDFALQAVALDPANVAPLAKLGAVSFEIFLGEVAPEWTITDMGQLMTLVETVASAGVVAGISPADNGIVKSATERERARGAKDRLSFFRTRPPIAEVLGVVKAAAIASGTGARVHLRQLTCAAALGPFREARTKHAGLSAEVAPHYLYLTEQELERQGPWAKVLPPLRAESDVAAMWHALTERTIDIVATDHAPHSPEEKHAGEVDLSKAPGGFPGVQTLLPLMLQGVASGRLSWPELVRICSESPARLFGINGRKGTLSPGADADVVIVDPRKAWVIRNEEQLSKAAITPFAGFKIQGQPVRVLLRGRTISQNGQVAGEPLGSLVRPSSQ